MIKTLSVYFIERLFKYEFVNFLKILALIIKVNVFMSAGRRYTKHKQLFYPATT